ncbi:hypothetical protein UFOVP466_14 [uncultured Caudovirales phage]|uniref:Uncharacterized protein n=1 Tax=uncultured Caudovirales phage TaxID=2100421 RepID=A0A6J5RB97_9CAUD|nr:hypothetical protein UFOVP466_14 [uncultured Caudovirales phage]CAB4180612.1 hypothetical protein UFOVP1045_61 [uncultured Caudovirales phage]CAB4189825.1 hypothetical protein UFOVP1194_15 [uncultured Caudovirales phage]CAB4221774.1 hypothetical protein UFOVP1641_11 [uncultured Caudovirales phage]
MNGEVRERLRLLERDHEPDGWPAVRMGDISAVLDMLAAVTIENQCLRTVVKDCLSQLIRTSETKKTKRRKPGKARR